MLRTIILVLLICLFIPLNAQNFTDQEILQGYRKNGDETIFIFGPEIYDQSPEKVVVTGSFRGWDSNMDHPDWNLQSSGDYWTLAVDNPDFAVIPASAAFKFRVDNGVWLDPPAKASNSRGGNLVYMMDVIPPSLKAEILSSGNIMAWIEGMDRPLDPASYRLTNATGEPIPISKILPNTITKTLVVPGASLDIRRVYYLEIPSEDIKSVCSFDGWFRELYSDKELGANVSASGTAIRIFSPRAEQVKLYLYRTPVDEAYQTIDMIRDENGVWEASFDENLKGIYYDFSVHGPKESGNHFYETEPVKITDPYARVSLDTWGRARIWEKTKPATPLKNGIPRMEDVIAYEVHLQDFTDLLPVNESMKSSIPAMVQPGLRNTSGDKIGFDYLVNLGINVVHLLPMQEYLHYSDKEWQQSFLEDEYMITHGINKENYQWGYRTSHCFAVESRYRKPGTEPGDERNQFRDLVQAFHDNGIAVIIDIVPNHTAENMDGNSFFFNFNVLDKQYYYRTKNLNHVGEYGNEVKTENRPMTQRWLIDQCKHWMEEFGIDGFRIDLAGQIDEQTLIALRKELGDAIVYGEPWIGSNDPAYEANPDWDWYKEDSPITFFQDDTRNAFKGPVFDLESKEKDRGWAGGNFLERDHVKKGLINQFPEDKTPLSGINYLDIHDNYALADQFASEDFNGELGVDEGNYKIAATLLFTSLGPIVLHGGSEMMRSKGSAPLQEVMKETKSGYRTYGHGKRDTYNQRKPNQFVWENVGKTKNDEGSNADYAGMLAFWKGLIALRKSDYGEVFRIAERVNEDYYQWLEPENPFQLGYIVNDQIAVLLNTGEESATFKNLTLPEGKWKLIGNNSGVDHVQGVKDVKKLMNLKGEQSFDIIMDATSLRIWVKK